jgi:hypothetical protein
MPAVGVPGRRFAVAAGRFFPAACLFCGTTIADTLQPVSSARAVVSLASTKRTGSIGKGESIVKTGSAQCLVFVAIVASAAAVQLRDRVEPAAPGNQGDRTMPSVRCDAGRGGVLLARCATAHDARGTHGETGIDAPRAPSGNHGGRHAQPRDLWV